jgi:hypothetical protein
VRRKMDVRTETLFSAELPFKRGSFTASVRDHNLREASHHYYEGKEKLPARTMTNNKSHYGQVVDGIHGVLCRLHLRLCRCPHLAAAKQSSQFITLLFDFSRGNLTVPVDRGRMSWDVSAEDGRSTYGETYVDV